MEKMNTKEDFLKRFEAAKQRKHEMVENMKEDITVEYEKIHGHEMVENMKEDITVEYEKIHGEKPKSFFVL